jgi:SAM-dependent methyltransferase
MTWMPRRLERWRPQLCVVRRAGQQAARGVGSVLTVAGTVAFERRLGLETDQLATLEDLGVAGCGRMDYQPSAWFSLRRFLPLREVGPTDVFLDVGSGKGRMLIVAASRYPLRRVEGIEVSPHLAAVARANIQRARPRLRCQDVSVVVADASLHPVPDDVTIIYLYNSIVDDAFEAFAARAIESFDRKPRQLRLIYRHPTQAAALHANHRVRLIRSSWRGLSSLGQRERIALYDIVPATVRLP